MVQGIEVDRRFLTNPHNSSTKSELIRRRAVLISPERTPVYVFNLSFILAGNSRIGRECHRVTKGMAHQLKWQFDIHYIDLNISH